MNKNEKMVIRKIYLQWLQSDIVAHNVNIFRFESDILALKSSGYTTEYEIKMSVSDFRNDFKKKKYVNTSDYNKQKEYISKHDFIKSGQGANRFYYCMPIKVFEKVQNEIPEFAGIVIFILPKDGVSTNTVVWAKRSAKLIRKDKPDYNEIKNSILVAMYYKSWNSLNRI